MRHLQQLVVCHTRPGAVGTALNRAQGTLSNAPSGDSFHTPPLVELLF